MYHEHTVAIQE